ncbi:MAG: hypothetical protein AAGE43_07675 [Pseudomonadota bacterium]
MAKFMLIGLCEPPDDASEAAFKEWFLDEHIEDTARCPGFVKSQVFRLAGPHLDIDTPARYLSLYEVEAESYEAAERLINDWQADPKAWEGRGKHWATASKFDAIPLRVGGSGWYELLAAYDEAGERTE